jgi:predicted TIM-barrel fold metal-dependent hydrolase
MPQESGQTPPIAWWADANVSIGHYPFRKFPIAAGDPGVIKAYLQSKGIDRAHAASLNAVFYGDPEQGNAEVLPNLIDDPFFYTVGIVNPSLQNWRETLARCVEVYGCQMVRILPSYHLYPLTAPFVEEFLAATQTLGVLPVIVQRLEDERAHNPLMKVPAPDLNDVGGIAQRFDAPLLLLNAYHAEIRQLAKTTTHLYFDLAFAETMNTIASLSQDIDPARLVFGTHTPFLYAEGAMSKVENWQADANARNQVAGKTLASLLPAITEG